MFAKYPFLLPLMGMIIGILLQEYLEATIYVPIICLSCVFFCIFFFKSVKNYYYLFVLFSIFFSGTFLGSTATFLKQEILLNKTIDTNHYNLYSGYISESLVVKNNRLKTIVILDNPETKIICYFKPSFKANVLKVGDRISFTTRMRSIQNFQETGRFDYKSYMYHKEIMYSAQLYSDEWEILKEPHSSLYIYSQKLRLKVIGYFSDVLCLNGDALGLSSALLLGTQDLVSEDLKVAFRTTGTIHILSVSGLHVSLIYSFIILSISMIPLLRKFRILSNICVIFFLVCYSFLTGLSPSVVRASSMLILICLSNIINKRGNSLNNLFIVAFFMLVYNPFMLWDIGFQLSFMSVLFIFLFLPLFEAKFKIRNKYYNLLKDMLLISVVAQLATFPLVLYYFGTFPNYFFLTNLVIVPYANFIILATIILSLFHLVTLISNIDFVFNIIDSVFMKINFLFIDIVFFLSKLPFALLDNFYFSLVEVIITYLILIGIFLLFQKKKLIYLKIILILSCILMFYNTLDLLELI